MKLKKYSFDKNHAWYCVGDIKFQRKDFSGALLAFKNALAADGLDVACLIAIGNCYDALNRFSLAARYFGRALGMKCSGKLKAAAAFNLGNALFDMGRIDEALEIYKSLVRRRDDVGVRSRINMRLVEARRRKTSDL